MLNQANLIGKVIDTLSLENGFYVVLEVKRNFKEVDGSFKNDIIKCRIWRSLVDDCSNRFKIGMKLSVSGKINCVDDDFYLDCYDFDYLGSELK